MLTSPRRFAYLDQRSTFETLSSSTEADLPLHVEHVRTSPGYNTSPLPRHVVGLHLGPPVAIAHWRDHVETLHHFHPGDVVFTPAGSPVHYAHPAPVEGLYLAIDPSYVRETSAHMGLDVDQVILCDQLGVADPTIDALGRAFLEEFRSPAVGGKLYTEALTMQLIVHLVRRYAMHADRPGDQHGVEPGVLHTRLRPARDYIHDHFSDDLSLAELAAVVHLTPYHFSRLFKRAYGISPYQYVIQQRIAAATYLLQNPRLTVAEIALRVGFADHSHLSRHYKRLMGTPPRS